MRCVADSLIWLNAPQAKGERAVIPDAAAVLRKALLSKEVAAHDAWRTIPLDGFIAQNSIQ
jgi:hypothetical protein